MFRSARATAISKSMICDLRATTARFNETALSSMPENLVPGPTYLWLPDLADVTYWDGR